MPAFGFILSPAGRPHIYSIFLLISPECALLTSCYNSTFSINELSTFSLVHLILSQGMLIFNLFSETTKGFDPLKDLAVIAYYEKIEGGETDRSRVLFKG